MASLLTWTCRLKWKATRQTVALLRPCVLSCLQRICSILFGFRIGLCDGGRHAMRSWQNLPTNPSNNLKGWKRLGNGLRWGKTLERVAIKRCSMQIRAISFISYSPKCEGVLWFHNLTPNSTYEMWMDLGHPCSPLAHYQLKLTNSTVATMDDMRWHPDRTVPQMFGKCGA